MKFYGNILIIYLLVSCFMIGNATAEKKHGKKIVGEEVIYTSNGVTFKGFIAYDAQQQGKRPAIVVVPEWWGNNDYSKHRAKMLAELGYIAIAADMYGDGKVATDPTRAMELAKPFYGNPTMGKERVEAAIAKIKEYAQTDEQKVAAIGYCFGGSMVLNSATMGLDLKGVVSFHGGLKIAPATKGSVKGKILVCNGAADKTINETDITNFKNNMESVGVSYQFINYPDATHAFTNPESTENGKKFNLPISYNEKADKKSWEDMVQFFKSIF